MKFAPIINSWRVLGMSSSACVLLYDVPLYWSLLGLRYPVPELHAALQSQGALQGGFTRDSGCGEQLCYCVSLEQNGVLLNLCGHSQLKPEVKHEIRGLSI